MEYDSQSKFDLNRLTLKTLLDDPHQLDLIELKDVTDDVEKVLRENNLPEMYWNQCILTGSYAATLAGVGENYRDIDLFTYNDMKLTGKYGIIEFVIKKKWKDAFPTQLPRVKYQQNLIFGSLIIHLFDLDCCRFVCVRNDSHRWILYTCSSGDRFLKEKINYVDKFNARSLKVHSRIQKYKERGIESQVELPDKINISGDIYSYTPKKYEEEPPVQIDGSLQIDQLLSMMHGKRKVKKLDNSQHIIHDDRDILWFLNNQHGIHIPKTLPWYDNYTQEREKLHNMEEVRKLVIDTVETKIRTHSTLLRAIVSLIKQLPDEYVSILEKEIDIVGRHGKIYDLCCTNSFEKCRYKYVEKSATHCFFPVVHKEKVYWIEVVHGDVDYNVLSVSFFAYEDYKNYTSRSKTYIKRDLRGYQNNLSRSPLPKEVIEEAINLFEERLSISDSEEESSSDEESE